MDLTGDCIVASTASSLHRTTLQGMPVLCGLAVALGASPNARLCVGAASAEAWGRGFVEPSHRLPPSKRLAGRGVVGGFVRGALLPVDKTCWLLAIPMREYLAATPPMVVDRNAPEAVTLTPMGWKPDRLGLLGSVIGARLGIIIRVRLTAWIPHLRVKLPVPAKKLDSLLAGLPILDSRMIGLWLRYSTRGRPKPPRVPSPCISRATPMECRRRMP